MSTLPQMRLETQARRYEASWHSLQSELDLGSARLQLLLDITNSMVAHVELNDLLRDVTIELGDSCNQILPSWHSWIHRVAYCESTLPSLPTIACLTREQLTLRGDTGRSCFLYREAMDRHLRWSCRWAGFEDDLKWAAVGFKSGCCILPLVIRGRVLGILALGKREKLPIRRTKSIS